MNTSPKITIGITAYRVAKYLEECWQSVLDQTNDQWEAILVLDGGNDSETIELFNKIEHPNLRKFALTKNEGPYATRVLAIENTRTDWYCHLDDDDSLPHDMVQNLYHHLKKHPDDDFIYGHSQYFGENENRLVLAKTPGSEQLLYKTLFSATAPINLRLYKKLGGYCEELKWIDFDWDFWIGANEINAKGNLLDKVIYNRRVRKGNSGNTYFYQRPRVVEIIIKRHPIFFNSEEKKVKCRSKVFELVAREYRIRGDREKAKHFAELSIANKRSTKGLRGIIEEGNMPIWRYWLRTLARKLTSHSKPQ